MVKMDKLKKIKNLLKQEGFIIDGIVGSYTRGGKYNDMDILYHLDNNFFQKSHGFEGFTKLQEIKDFLSNNLNKKIDLIDKTTLNKIGKKYILKDIINV
jgi:predicted nucleotidyltransferase